MVVVIHHSRGRDPAFPLGSWMYTQPARLISALVLEAVSNIKLLWGPSPIWGRAASDDVYPPGVGLRCAVGHPRTVTGVLTRARRPITSGREPTGRPAPATRLAPAIADIPAESGADDSQRQVGWRSAQSSAWPNGRHVAGSAGTETTSITWYGSTCGWPVTGPSDSVRDATPNPLKVYDPCHTTARLTR